MPLGIIPSGTGNDMARVLNIPHDNTEAAIEVLAEALQNGPRTIDAARISYIDDATGKPAQRWFLCALSAGFDAIVNERANNMRNPKGPSRYIIALMIELTKLRPIKYKITLDGRVIETEGALVSIGNGVSLGGGMKITPDAKVDDGLLDVLIVKPLGAGRVHADLPARLQGRAHDRPARHDRAGEAHPDRGGGHGRVRRRRADRAAADRRRGGAGRGAGAGSAALIRGCPQPCSRPCILERLS